MKKWRYAFFTSLLLHLLMMGGIIYLVWGWHKSNTLSSAQVGFSHVEQVYVLSRPVLFSEKSNEQKAKTKSVKTKQAPEKAIRPNKISAQPVSMTQSTPSLPAISVNGQSSPVLILLHNAIQQTLSMYSDELGAYQKEMVQVGFIAHPDGSLDNISVLSKNVPAGLSQALIAVLYAMPKISALQNTLVNPQYFTLWIHLS